MNLIWCMNYVKKYFDVQILPFVLYDVKSKRDIRQILNIFKYDLWGRNIWINLRKKWSVCRW